VTLTFDLRVNARRATAIEYMRTKFGVDSSSRFPFRAWTNRQNHMQTYTVTDDPKSKQFAICC